RQLPVLINETFFNKSTLNTHLLLHSNEKHFQCSVFYIMTKICMSKYNIFVKYNFHYFNTSLFIQHCVVSTLNFKRTILS
ncbi:hypothetical protein L9F63_027685, partial [Diploptera punctata]